MNSIEKTNILKVRDDHELLRFLATEPGKFAFTDGRKPEWAKGENFDLNELRKHVEPWLTALFQSEHLSLLAGSGLTQAIHRLATDEAAAGMDRPSFSVLGDKIAAAADASAHSSGRGKANIEDDLRVANELLRGMQIAQSKDSSAFAKEIGNVLETFAEKILLSEAGITSADSATREKALNTLVTFLMSFASRTGTRDRLNIFTTNYDRLIEMGSELAGLHLLDRFVGNLLPVFRASRMDLDLHYNPPGIRGEPRYLEGVARFTKLHGSIDWAQTDGDIRRVGLPFGAEAIDPYLQVPGFGTVSAHGLMVYPNAAKDSETALYPYVELFRDFAAALCRPNSTLVTYGYSFGDEHINRVIRDMLTIPSTHLVIISFDDDSGRIINNYNRIGRPSQVSLLIGPALADIINLTQRFLPKAAIDRTTLRMSELISARFGISKAEEQKDPTLEGLSAEDLSLL